MTEAQEKLVELDKKRAEYKEFLEELTAVTETVGEEIGINSYFQDDEGVVYKVIVPAGKWMVFDHIGYVRTKRGDEAKGSLSAKEAKEAGFEV